MNDFGCVLKVFEQLNLIPDVSSFEDRIIIQKVMYLLSIKDLDCGYNFDLYLRGPYSPKLTEDMFVWWEGLEEIDRVEIQQIKAIRRAEKQVEFDRNKEKSREVMWGYDR